MDTPKTVKEATRRIMSMLSGYPIERIETDEIAWLLGAIDALHEMEVEKCLNTAHKK